MGKELANTKPKSISKAFDEETGEVMYNQVCIEKDVWSTAIPRTLEKFRESLLPLFECRSVLEDVLNPQNKMVLAGADTTVTVIDDSGNKREINVVTQLIPLLDSADILEVQDRINQLFSLEQGTLLYLSSGAGRGEEIKKLHSFNEAFTLHFNVLHFHMRSGKGISHGVNLNDWVDHFVPPSLSPIIVVLNLCVYPAAHQNPHLQVPTKADAKNGAREMFQNIFRVQGSSTKDFREYCILIMNYIAPLSLSETSTPPEYARQYHHSASMHNKNYSSMRYRRTSDGRMEKSSLLVAREYHQALGETCSNNDRVADIDEDWIPDHMYQKALQRALGTSAVKCNHHQMEACRFLDDYSNKVHAMVFRPTGTGKSFMWNGILLARYLRGSKRKRFVVLSPHSALLAQHVLQSKEFFHGTSLKVTSITSTDIDTLNTMDEFDLCYISIHAFAIIVDDRKELIESWDIGTVYIDEIHLLFCELFRLGNSWRSIQDIQKFGTKLVCLSATINDVAMKIVAHYMGIGDNYTVIGDTTSYSPPNVAILLKRVNDCDLIRSVTDTIKQRISSLPKSANFAIHVMTMTKNQATNIADILELANIRCTWLTSDDSRSTRTQKMRDWAAGDLDVLVSTMNCGFDCGQCKEAYIVGGVRSVADAIQSIGRIRPMQQDGEKTPTDRCVVSSNSAIICIYRYFWSANSAHHSSNSGQLLRK